MQPGTQLGSYEIPFPLGKGGMGEVWNAKDTKLGRDVAIKTLPEEFAKDEEIGTTPGHYEITGKLGQDFE